MKNLPAQCSRSSSLMGTVKSLVWSNWKVIESRWRASSVSGLTTGGTTIVSPWLQNVYWQNTKCDRDSGSPEACFILTWIAYQHQWNYKFLVPKLDKSIYNTQMITGEILGFCFSFESYVANITVCVFHHMRLNIKIRLTQKAR